MGLRQELSLKWLISGILHSLAGALLVGNGLVNPVSAEIGTPTPRDRAALLAQTNPEGTSPGLRVLLSTGRSLPGAVTSRTPSPIRLSVPSLWWITKQLVDLQQFGSKFIQDWVALPRQDGRPGQVDLLVNRQQWSLLDYVQRYEFVSKFSSTARTFGYNTRVFDSPDRAPIAIYRCDFSPKAAEILQAPPRKPNSPLESAIAVKTRSTLSTQLSCDLQMVQPGRRNQLQDLSQ